MLKNHKSEDKESLCEFDSDSDSDSVLGPSWTCNTKHDFIGLILIQIQLLTQDKDVKRGIPVTVILILILIQYQTQSKDLKPGVTLCFVSHPSFFLHSIIFLSSSRSVPLPPSTESTVEMPSVPAAPCLWRYYWLKKASVDAHTGHMTLSLSLADRCSTYRHTSGRGFAFPLLDFLLLLYKMIESWKLYLQKCHLIRFDLFSQDIKLFFLRENPKSNNKAKQLIISMNLLVFLI